MMLCVSCFLISFTANLIVFSLVLNVDWYALLSVVLTDSIAMVTSGEVVVVRGIVVAVSGIAVVTLWHVISWVVEPLNVVKEPLGHLCLVEGLKAITLVYSSKHTNASGRRVLNDVNLAIISLWKGVWTFLWTNLNLLMMLCVKFGWNWPSGSGEENENVKYLETDGQMGRHTHDK